MSHPLAILPPMMDDLARTEQELLRVVAVDGDFLTEIASHLIKAGGKRVRPGFAMASMYLTEDKRFYDHDGLRLGLIERAVKLNLEHGRYVYGGSSISQQLHGAHNLWFSRPRTRVFRGCISFVVELLLDVGEIDFSPLTIDEG